MSPTPTAKARSTLAPRAHRPMLQGGGGGAAKASSPLSGCTLVISGIQNPDRARLRDAALKLGARYASDWGPGATHLVCAFRNTPKYIQVKQAGGMIVTAGWVAECERKGSRAAESMFGVK